MKRVSYRTGSRCVIGCVFLVTSLGSNRALAQNFYVGGNWGYHNELGGVVALADLNATRADAPGSDLILGLPYSDPEGFTNSAGQVVVLFSDGIQKPEHGSGFKYSYQVVLSQDAPGIDGFAESGDLFGSAIGAGDFDNDGNMELVIGAKGEALGSKNWAGMLHVIRSSGAHGTDLTDEVSFHQASPGVEGAAEAGDLFGSEFATGDFDGDGYDDLAIGVPGEDVGSILNAGAVNVLYGGSGGLNSAGDQLFHQNTSGILGTSREGDEFGSVLAAGDLNGDGFDDLAIGIPNKKVSGQANAGSVAVLYGSASGLSASGDQLWDQGQLHSSSWVEAGDGFGSALAIGNFNGDRYADLAIGVPGEAIGSTSSAGLVDVVYGSSNGLTANGVQAFHQNTAGMLGLADMNDYFGSALVTADFDVDGHDDLAVGVPGETVSGVPSAGLVSVIHGSASGLNSADNLIRYEGSPDPNGFWQMAGYPHQNERFGAALAAGMVRPDGPTLIVGVPEEWDYLALFDDPRARNGLVYICDYWGPGYLSANYLNSQLWLETLQTPAP